MNYKLKTPGHAIRHAVYERVYAPWYSEAYHKHGWTVAELDHVDWRLTRLARPDKVVLVTEDMIVIENCYGETRMHMRGTHEEIERQEIETARAAGARFVVYSDASNAFPRPQDDVHIGAPRAKSSKEARAERSAAKVERDNEKAEKQQAAQAAQRKLF